MTDERVVQPRFIGGPWDGQTIKERFEPGHPLHGTLPNGVRVPTNPPPGPRLPMHEYLFEAGDYVYQGEVEE